MRIVEAARGAVWVGVVVAIAVIVVTPALAVAWAVEKVDKLGADPKTAAYEV